MRNDTFPSSDVLLEKLGLERHRSSRAALLTSLGLVALGAGVGAALGLLFAPRSGTMLRSELLAKAGRLRARMHERLTELPPIRVRGGPAGR